MASISIVFGHCDGPEPNKKKRFCDGRALSIICHDVFATRLETPEGFYPTKT